MTDSYMDFTFDSGDEKLGKKSKRFKGREGETYRISLAWFAEANEDGSPNMDGNVQFTGCERHYMQGVGYFLHKGAEFAKLAGGAPKQAVATIVVVWPTDKKGTLNSASFSKGTDYEVMPWVFSSERYDQLKNRHVEWPLSEHDLILSCTDTQYQKMDISPAKDNLLRKLVESDKDKARAISVAIMEQVQKIESSIRTDLARDLTLEQLREKLGGSTASPVTGGAAEENVDELLDNLLD